MRPDDKILLGWLRQCLIRRVKLVRQARGALKTINVALEIHTERPFKRASFGSMNALNAHMAELYALDAEINSLRAVLGQ